MRREYEYTVKVSIEEKPRRDRADRKVQQLLTGFEEKVKDISLESAGTTLKVDNLNLTGRSKEMRLSDGQHLFMESPPDPNFFLKVKDRLRRIQEKR